MELISQAVGLLHGSFFGFLWGTRLRAAGTKHVLKGTPQSSDRLCFSGRMPIASGILRGSGAAVASAFAALHLSRPDSKKGRLTWAKQSLTSES